MLSDWIGSDTRFFPLGIESDRRTLAESGAAHALKTIGLLPKRLLSLPPFEKCFEGGFTPSPLQQAIEELPLDPNTQLVLVESDTGSGKTEAALRWFWRLYAGNHVDGLYFALPTRVAARELYGRVLKTVETVFPDRLDRPSPVLLAVPGYVQADGVPAALQHPEDLLWEDDRYSALSEKLWAAERPKRFLAAPIAVGTIDQALLSALKVKHSLLRSVCLDRLLLVVDEVHASDTYMSGILDVLLKGHVARGGFAMLLSATLGESARATYLDLPTLSLPEAIERPYPSITIHGKEVPVASTSPSKSVRLHWIESLQDETLLPHLREALLAGGRVLVTCNTVDRAQALLKTVESAGFDPAWLFHLGQHMACPHHGRFARCDREILDRAVSQRFGKGTPQGPVLLIGTQTLEQSLDIDADYLITDPAPIDVLLQRIGRLHRHKRIRPPGYEQALVSIRIPDQPLHVYLNHEGRLKGPAGIGSVYDDGRMLQRTIDVLSEMKELRIPEQNRYLVEECTHDEALEKLPEALWRQHRDWLWGGRLADLRQAQTAVMPNEPFGEFHYPDDGSNVFTRLGESDISVRFSTPMKSPFGQTIEEILLPYWWLPARFAKTDPVTPAALSDGAGFTFEVAGRRFQYTRFGLERMHDESVD
ncbi:CRISPR-associated helicase Cas3' [Desulfatirhabdium butyrativorans]|uniref:CRISPR-associated helicase Cas3' n=1 Tax=Desulfatirhabdium butyrativorans TaxID=340467 RepID=UPI001FE154F2|nr:CRISPR-associated helicase Cas3' [Desulfatirhabdium butyrativorans]